MLYEFITTYREAIITRAREKLTARPWPKASEPELENGVPLFLTQLSETLRSGSAGTQHSHGAIGSTATRHGGELLALGFTVSQVVHDYGDICQAVTELAIEQNAPITTDEFKTLNGCLDTAIAEAVTEHARITAESRSTEESERSGQIAHETRDLLGDPGVSDSEAWYGRHQRQYRGGAWAKLNGAARPRRHHAVRHSHCRQSAATRARVGHTVPQ